MSVSMKVDIKGLQNALKKIELSESDMINLIGAGSYVINNAQRLRVPVRTGATKTSIKSHIVESSKERVEDEVGPETVYAPNIEYGRQDMPNYPIQPFIRPSVEGNEANIRRPISMAFKVLVEQRWPR